MVTVKLFANLREAAGGKRQVDCDIDGPASTAELLQHLVDAHGEQAQKLLFNPEGSVWPAIVIMHNGNMLRDRDEKAISSGDEVAVLLPVAGG